METIKEFKAKLRSNKNHLENRIENLQGFVKYTGLEFNSDIENKQIENLKTEIIYQRDKLQSIEKIVDRILKEKQQIKTMEEGLSLVK